MIPKYKDRVKETSLSTGTSDFVLAGAVTGYQSIDAGYDVDEDFYYTIEGLTGQWEVGLGHLSAPTTLVRETVLASSNAGALVNFSAGLKTVFVTVPAAAIQSPWHPNPDTFFGTVESPFRVSNYSSATGVGTHEKTNGSWATMLVEAELNYHGTAGSIFGIFNYLNPGGDYTGGAVYGMYQRVVNINHTNNPTTSMTGIYTSVNNEASNSGSILKGLELSLLKGNINTVHTMRGIEIGMLTGYSTMEEMTGVDVKMQTGSSGAPVTLARGLRVRSLSTGSTPHHWEDLRGISIDSWTNTIASTYEDVYGIYIDNSIDRGAVQNWCFYSLSVSPSLFSGPVRVPDDAYGAGWNASLEVPTKNALWDKIESLGGGFESPASGSFLADDGDSTADSDDFLFEDGDSA